MAEEKQTFELSPQEQEEVAELFADFASRHWSNPQKENPEDEKAPAETAEKPEDVPEKVPEEPSPARNRLSKKALIAIGISTILCVSLICLAIYLLHRHEEPLPM